MYKIVFAKSAIKDLEKVINVYYQSIVSHIKELGENPRPFGSVKLSDSNRFFEICYVFLFYQ